MVVSRVSDDEDEVRSLERGLVGQGGNEVGIEVQPGPIGIEIDLAVVRVVEELRQGRGRLRVGSGNEGVRSVKGRYDVFVQIEIVISEAGGADEEVILARKVRSRTIRASRQRELILACPADESDVAVAAQLVVTRATIDDDSVGRVVAIVAFAERVSLPAPPLIMPDLPSALIVSLPFEPVTKLPTSMSETEALTFSNWPALTLP